MRNMKRETRNKEFDVVQNLPEKKKEISDLNLLHTYWAAYHALKMKYLVNKSNKMPCPTESEQQVKQRIFLMQAMLVPLRKLITYLTFGKLACAILQTKTLCILPKFTNTRSEKNRHVAIIISVCNNSPKRPRGLALFHGCAHMPKPRHFLSTFSRMLVLLNTK